MAEWREVEKGIKHFKWKKSIRFDWEVEEAGWEMVNTQFFTSGHILTHMGSELLRGWLRKVVLLRV